MKTYKAKQKSGVLNLIFGANIYFYKSPVKKMGLKLYNLKIHEFFRLNPQLYITAKFSTKRPITKTRYQQLISYLILAILMIKLHEYIYILI